MPSKSRLVEIGGKCFLGSASILFDRAALGLMRCTPNLGVLCGGRIRILELCCCFLLIEPPFEGEAWSAGGAKHGSMHQEIFLFFVTGYSSICELPALLEAPLVNGHVEKKLFNSQEAM
jgi:hypothetical protein